MGSRWAVCLLEFNLRGLCFALSMTDFKKNDESLRSDGDEDETMAESTLVHPPSPSHGATSRRERPSDDGNARRFMRRFGERVRHVPAQGWLLWNDKWWEPDRKGEVRQLAKEIVADLFEESKTTNNGDRANGLWRFGLRCETPARIKAMLESASTEPGVVVLPEALDADPWKLNCTNGTVDLRTGQLLPHRKEDLITKIVNVDHDQTAECPRFLAYLRRVLANDEELINYVQRVLGYTLTGDMREHAFFILFGSGANGKSLLLSILQFILGPYMKTAAPEVFLKRQHSGHPTEVADLQGCRLVATHEVESGRAFNEALLKQLTGGDCIKARFMRQDFFEFQPTAKIVIQANTLPEITGGDNGIWRRVQIIPFDVTIPEHERDKELIQKLKAEASGVFAWMVRGCLAWQQRGLTPLPVRVRRAGDSYRAQMDVVGRFIADRCEQDPRARVSAATLYTAYEAWCLRNGEAPMTGRTFGTRLNEHGIPSQKTKGVIIRLGLRLKDSCGEEGEDGEHPPTSSSPLLS